MTGAWKELKALLAAYMLGWAQSLLGDDITDAQLLAFCALYEAMIENDLRKPHP